MLQAALNSKLHEGEIRCEDTLTSSVFGIMRYLPNDIFWKIIYDSEKKIEIYCLSVMKRFKY